MSQASHASQASHRPRGRALLVAATLLLAGVVAIGGGGGASAQTAPGLTATFTKASEWSGGYVGDYTIRNGGTAPTSGWRVEFDLPAGTTLTNSWNATVTAGGSHYSAQALSWNATIAAGGTASFGFQASGNGAPTGCTLNGGPCGGGSGGGDTQPPTAPANLRVTATTSSSVSLAWNPSSDNVGVAGYDIASGDTVVASTSGTSATVGNLAADSSFQFSVTARDAAGNRSAASNTVQARTAPGGQLGEVRTVADNLQIPWGVAFLPDGSALVAERNTAAIIRVTAAGQKTTVGTVPGVVPGGEGGLLGLAISPSFASDRLLYAYFTAASDNRIVRMTFSTAGQLGTPQPVLTGIPKGTIHNGGRLAFGPDGMLYAGTGESGQRALAQDPASLGGKILRMTPTGQPAPGNPIAGSVVFSLGHRNVQGLAFDSQGRLWASEFGENTADELNLIRAGSNYGWPTCEGRCGRAGLVDPVFQWATAEASPSGVAIVGDVIFMASLRGARLWRMPIAGNGVQTPQAFFVGTFGRLRTVIPSPDGGLWLTTNNRDGRGTPMAGDDRILRVALG